MGVRIERDALKIIVKTGAKVVARFFSSEAGILSGPLALWIFKLESKAVTPAMVTSIDDISGKEWPSMGRNVRCVLLSEN